jgi:hypothetical protein
MKPDFIDLLRAFIAADVRFLVVAAESGCFAEPADAGAPTAHACAVGWWRGPVSNGAKDPAPRSGRAERPAESKYLLSRPA